MPKSTRGASTSQMLQEKGLGKDKEFDPQVDTYPRVMVGRLRKALDTYYATDGADHPYRLVIESGSYGVTLAAQACAGGSPPAADGDC